MFFLLFTEWWEHASGKGPVAQLVRPLLQPSPSESCACGLDHSTRSALRSLPLLVMYCRPLLSHPPFTLTLSINGAYAEKKLLKCFTSHDFSLDRYFLVESTGCFVFTCFITILLVCCVVNKMFFFMKKQTNVYLLRQPRNHWAWELNCPLLELHLKSLLCGHHQHFVLLTMLAFNKVLLNYFSSLKYWPFFKQQQRIII